MKLLSRRLHQDQNIKQNYKKLIDFSKQTQMNTSYLKQKIDDFFPDVQFFTRILVHLTEETGNLGQGDFLCI